MSAAVPQAGGRAHQRRTRWLLGRYCGQRWVERRYSKTPAVRRMSPTGRTSSSSRVRAGWRTDTFRLLQHSRYVAGTNR